MASKLSSRERVMLTINHSEPDRVPLLFPPWPFPLAPASSYTDFRRAEYLLSLGIDAAIPLHPPTFFPNAIRPLAPNVETRVWKENLPGEDYPVLFKEYKTPGGTLKQIVRQTLDWPHGDDIPFVTDFCVPSGRSIKHLIENENDLEALSYLFADPSDAELKKFLQQADEVKRFAGEQEILVTSGGFGFAPLFAADAMVWLCGIENSLLAAIDKPAFVHRLLGIIMGWNQKYLGLLEAAGGVDLVAHRAYYESSQFWSPRLYEEFILPVIRKEIELVHQIGAKYCYISVDGGVPFQAMLAEAGIDVLFGLDPVEKGMDYKRIKEHIGDRVCLWTGVSEHTTIDSLDKKAIANEVRHAIETLAPGGGFILSSVDNRSALLWKETDCMIDTWRTMCSYPTKIS